MFKVCNYLHRKRAIAPCSFLLTRCESGECRQLSLWVFGQSCAHARERYCPAWRWEAVVTKVVRALCILVLAMCGMSIRSDARQMSVRAPLMMKSPPDGSGTIRFRAIETTGAGAARVNHAFLQASDGGLAERSDLSDATMLRAGEAVNAQLSPSAAVTQGTRSFPEPMSLVLFGAGLLGIATLFRRRPIGMEKTAKSREHVTASHPPLPVERS